MNMLSIQYFLAIVEEGNISAAARKLFISQQTLSEHVKKLEDELGTPLFKRGRQIRDRSSESTQMFSSSG